MNNELSPGQTIDVSYDETLNGLGEVEHTGEVYGVEDSYILVDFGDYCAEINDGTVREASAVHRSVKYGENATINA